MSDFKIGIVSDDHSIADILLTACTEVGIPYDIKVYDSAIQYLKAPHKHHLSLVAPTSMNLSDYGVIMKSERWVYLSDGDTLPISVLRYRPMAAINIKSRDEALEICTDTVYDLARELLGHNLPATADAIPLQRLNGTIVSPMISDIISCRTNGDYLDVYIREGTVSTKLMVQERMKTLVDKLDDHGFVQTHRLWLVNINEVKDNHPYPKADIHLKDGSVVPLARRRKIQFLKAYRSRPTTT